MPGKRSVIAAKLGFFLAIFAGCSSNEQPNAPEPQQDSGGTTLDASAGDAAPADRSVTDSSVPDGAPRDGAVADASRADTFADAPSEMDRDGRPALPEAAMPEGGDGPPAAPDAGADGPPAVPDAGRDGPPAGMDASRDGDGGVVLPEDIVLVPPV